MTTVKEVSARQMKAIMAILNGESVCLKLCFIIPVNIIDEMRLFGNIPGTFFFAGIRINQQRCGIFSL